jgi:Xaa-Pro aminopeptidase
MNVGQKLSTLRKLMSERNLDAFIIPSTDPHISEYVTPHWQSRMWFSGFTGSVATVVITKNHAGLWTDGRYFTQALEQLDGTEIKLHKIGIVGAVDYPEWLSKNLSKNSRLGFDGKVFPVNLVQKLEKVLNNTNNDANVELVSKFDLISEIWNDERENLPDDKIFIHPVEKAGESRTSKINKIRTSLKEKNLSHTLLCSLDDVCWTMNIRGYDVPFNPVAISYVLISLNSVELFVDSMKIPEDVRSELENDNIILREYSDISSAINNLSGLGIYIDSARTNFWLYDLIPNEMKIENGINFSTRLKAVKNDTEASGMRKAMERDCVALVDFAFWLENSFGSVETTELKAMKKLRETREDQDLFYGESFGTIAGYGSNGAIIHYGSTEETNKTILGDTFFLLDSGGQYFDGTTDITRMFHLGTPSDTEKRDYTLVLKGMIALSLQKFPEGTRGSQLDSLARQFLWNESRNYAHGTGHGVGAFMNVHEGPQNIRTDENMTKLESGMIVSNEPGFYRVGEYGIRIENLVLIREENKSEFGNFLEFETLTLFPIETKCIDFSVFTDQEKDWLNKYHTQVWDRCNALIKDDLKREWLKEKCRAI